MFITFYYRRDEYFKQEYMDNKEAFNQYTDMQNFLNDLSQLKRSWENYLEIRIEKLLPKKSYSWELIRDKLRGGKRNWSYIELFIMDYKRHSDLVTKLRDFFTLTDTGMGAKDLSVDKESSLYIKEMGDPTVELLGIYTNLAGDANTILIDRATNYYLYPIERIEWVDTPQK